MLRAHARFFLIFRAADPRGARNASISQSSLVRRPNSRLRGGRASEAHLLPAVGEGAGAGARARAQRPGVDRREPGRLEGAQADDAVGRAARARDPRRGRARPRARDPQLPRHAGGGGAARRDRGRVPRVAAARVRGRGRVPEARKVQPTLYARASARGLPRRWSAAAAAAQPRLRPADLPRAPRALRRAHAGRRALHRGRRAASASASSSRRCTRSSSSATTCSRRTRCSPRSTRGSRPSRRRARSSRRARHR